MGDIMKIMLGKKQWEEIGKKAGWISTSNGEESVSLFELMETWAIGAE